MREKNDPFFVILSVAITSTQTDGKILLWAWFQQFPEELQVQDVSPSNLKKTFDELLKRLDESAAERGSHVTGADASKQPLQPTQEEAGLINMASSYFLPGSGAVVVTRTVVDDMLKDCVSRIKIALNPRATDGEKEWTRAFIVNNRLRVCINLALKAIDSRENTALCREFCALLQNDIPMVREIYERYFIELSFLNSHDKAHTVA
ncbi:unnamed protein product [Strongylus vulgaris]|uniref:Uncharacterized protein n=1 Tax=Strongylus vulgaris TaxID=40348 RepID=A0A3P7J0X9_STRVU|nr:unnamed protein product [Strongylus vulgaris]